MSHDTMYQRIMEMSPDCRRRYAKKHKDDIAYAMQKGTRLKIMPHEVITVTKHEMVAFGIEHKTFDMESLEKALNDHPEAGFTAQDIIYMFKTARSYFRRVEAAFGLILKGKFVTFEQFMAEFQKLEIWTFNDYRKFFRSPEGRGWPSPAVIWWGFGSFRLFLMACLSKDLNYQFDLYCKMSIMRGAPLTRHLCLKFNIEYDELVKTVGLENLKNFIKMKRQLLEKQFEESNQSFSILDVLNISKEKNG